MNFFRKNTDRFYSIIAMVHNVDTRDLASHNAPIVVTKNIDINTMQLL